MAAENPDVVFVHQGGLEGDKELDNVGTYFGTVYEPVYLAGIAAGEASETGKLGYIYAFPIPQTLANINAFTLGAQSVNPEPRDDRRLHGQLVRSGVAGPGRPELLDEGVDVITQHQDCTKTIIEAAEAAGAFSVGYHADASELAPNGWITGSEWDWAALYTDIVKTVHGRQVRGVRLQRRLPGRTPDRRQPVHPVGVRLDGRADTNALIEAAKQSFIAGGSPFAGPVVKPGRHRGVGRGRAAHLRRGRDDGLLREGVTGSTD